MFDAGTWQPYEPLTTAPCGRPGQDTCPTAAGNLPALPGTGVVGGLLESVGELLGGLLSLSSLEDGELAARWARVRIEVDRLGRDKPAASPAPGRSATSSAWRCANACNGWPPAWPACARASQRHLQRPAADRRA